MTLHADLDSGPSPSRPRVPPTSGSAFANDQADNKRVGLSKRVVGLLDYREAARRTAALHGAAVRLGPSRAFQLAWHLPTTVMSMQQA